MKTESRIGRSGTESYTWVGWGGKDRGQGCAARKRWSGILNPKTWKGGSLMMRHQPLPLAPPGGWPVSSAPPEILIVLFGALAPSPPLCAAAPPAPGHGYSGSPVPVGPAWPGPVPWPTPLLVSCALFREPWPAAGPRGAGTVAVDSPGPKSESSHGSISALHSGHITDPLSPTLDVCWLSSLPAWEEQLLLKWAKKEQR